MQSGNFCVCRHSGQATDKLAAGWCQRNCKVASLAHWGYLVYVLHAPPHPLLELLTVGLMLQAFLVGLKSLVMVLHEELQMPLQSSNWQQSAAEASRVARVVFTGRFAGDHASTRGGRR